MALLPVVIPVVCILFGTLGSAMFDEAPLICSFLGNKLVAMTLGTLGAYLVSLPYIGRENLEKPSLIHICITHSTSRSLGGMTVFSEKRNCPPCAAAM